MQNQKIDPEPAYKTLVIIWSALLASQILLLGLIYMSKPELFNFDFSQPLLGENTIVVIVVALLGLHGLFLSLKCSSKYLKLAITDQKPELVQQTLITSVALSESVSLWGVFLAFAFDYQYFFVWMIAGFLATVLHFPRQSPRNPASLSPVFFRCQ